MGRTPLKHARRVVVKVGTNALTRGTGALDAYHFRRLCLAVETVARTRELVLVSSGAIALGVDALGLPRRPSNISLKQACAAVGQSRLMHAWSEALKPLVVAQVLLTHADVRSPVRRTNARQTLTRLLAAHALPIINENDTVATEEIRFGDNDALAAEVCRLVRAQALVILSDVDGVYDENPQRNPGARRIPEFSQNATQPRGSLRSQTGRGTGGMESKLRAARRVASYGTACVITSGLDPEQLSRALSGDDVGTYFPARR